MKLIHSHTEDFTELLNRFITRRYEVLDKHSDDVEAVIAAYRTDREVCLIECAKEIDHVELDQDSLFVDENTIKSSHRELSSEIKSAIDATKARVERIQEELKANSSFQAKEESGVYWGIEVRPIDAVGIYVPKDSFMNLLLCAVPANIAGVKEIIIATPPNKKFEPYYVAPEILYLAKLFEIEKIILAGGIAGMASLAFGTNKTNPVQKIVGSGGRLTMAAKQNLSGYVGIDGLTGPSETAFVCNQTTPVPPLVSDIIGLAGQNPQAEVLVFGDNPEWMERVLTTLAQHLDKLKSSNKEKINKCLSTRANFIVVKSIEEGIEYINKIAPGVVCIPIEDASAYTSQISACGSLLLGPSTSPVAMDLIGGATGLVSTFGSALYTNAMSPATFTRRFSVVELEKSALERLQIDSIELNKAEGFENPEDVYQSRLK